MICFVNLHKIIYLSNISPRVCLKSDQSLFALDCVVTVIGWLSVVHIYEIMLRFTEIQGDPETPNVFEM